MKAFLKRWPGTVGMVVFCLLVGLSVGAGAVLSKFDISPVWVSLPLFALAFIGVWRTDRALQRIRRDLGEE